MIVNYKCPLPVNETMFVMFGCYNIIVLLSHKPSGLWVLNLISSLVLFSVSPFITKYETPP